MKDPYCEVEFQAERGDDPFPEELCEQVGGEDIEQGMQAGWEEEDIFGYAACDVDEGEASAADQDVANQRTSRNESGVCGCSR